MWLQTLLLLIQSGMWETTICTAYPVFKDRMRKTCHFLCWPRRRANHQTAFLFLNVILLLLYLIALFNIICMQYSSHKVVNPHKWLQNFVSEGSLSCFFTVGGSWIFCLLWYGLYKPSWTFIFLQRFLCFSLPLFPLLVFLICIGLQH